MTTQSTRNFLTDNPELYELRFPDHDHSAGRFLHDVMRTHLTTSTPPDAEYPPAVLDIGCGTGRDMGYLSGLGYRCTGLDCSAEMVRYARSRHRDVRFVEADMREFDVAPRGFDAITCLDSSLLYCHTDDDLRACLDRCRSHTRPGGLLILEMRNGAYFLGNSDLMDHPTQFSVQAAGQRWRADTTLWIDHGSQLLRRRRVWHGADDEPVVQFSAWRLLFPLEIAGHLSRAGYTIRTMFDAPGPRVDGGWPAHPPRLPARGGTALAGDRLHIVAEAIT
ncbi:class I SAM-dependent methyltransferase [Gordonia sp. NPDC062954]|jgi:SAM-dependent methyltransferase|uniref:class I SAM-dependent methyltransferase n=1 Tax=unclassified Gordonia (in: high G+C Gram-positive bacteria) TaxID=2657482 RepID=UPI000C5ACF9C|nr:class I SAM-dependent methyltransferase [Gordonia sp. (in: high G+C Gram-positive bacteria)]MAU81462.1 SAM-dependent methyltransferase [Gordonia sp. (in: high G+C Gram-positive bacteria)]